MSLSNRVALVTGAGAGIGRAIAVAMGQSGAKVACVDIDPAVAEATAGSIRDGGGEALPIVADVGDLDQIDRMAIEANQGLGDVDVLVNNAGVTIRKYIMDVTEEDWDRIHRVNAKGVFFCLQRVARDMINRGGGTIINIASIAGRRICGHIERVVRGQQGGRDRHDAYRGSAAG